MIIDITQTREEMVLARLLDLVEGPPKQVFKDWLTSRPDTRRDAIEFISIDGFTGFKFATSEDRPDAVPVMDPLHVVRLARDGLFGCRQSVQQDTSRLSNLQVTLSTKPDGSCLPAPRDSP